MESMNHQPGFALASRRGSPKSSPRGTLHIEQTVAAWADEGLAEKEWFSGLSPRAQAELEDLSSTRIYTRGSLVFVEGERPAGVFFVRAGRIKLSATGADGRALLVRKAQAGDVIGLPGVISGKRSGVTAETLSPSECRFVARDAFLHFLRGHPESILPVAQILSDIYFGTLHQVRYLGLSSSTAERLARFLLDFPVADGNDGGSPFRLTHREIAAVIGASRETVTRILTRFRREQWLHLDGSRLWITNRSGLEQMLMD